MQHELQLQRQPLVSCQCFTWLTASAAASSEAEASPCGTQRDPHREARGAAIQLQSLLCCRWQNDATEAHILSGLATAAKSNQHPTEAYTRWTSACCFAIVAQTPCCNTLASLGTLSISVSKACVKGSVVENLHTAKAQWQWCVRQSLRTCSVIYSPSYRSNSAT